MLKFQSKQTDIKGPGAYTKIPSYSCLKKDLLSEGYMFVLTQRLQSDPIERLFSQYRQMPGGRFLVSLLEVRNAERILACRSLLKDDVDLWQEDPVTENEDIENFMSIHEEHETDIYE